MAYYDEGLIPLSTSIQYGANGFPGESNPWAQWQYQNAFTTQAYGTGQYGKQYSPGGAVGPRLAPRQPGTGPGLYPPGVVGTMQSSQYELSYMLEPGVVPRQSQVFGYQIPKLIPAPGQEARQMNHLMMQMRSARRGAEIRGGSFPTPMAMTPGAKLPPPICSYGEQLVQTSPGQYQCTGPYEGACPGGMHHKGFYGGMPVCEPMAGHQERMHPSGRASGVGNHPGRGTRALNPISAAPTKPTHEACREVCKHLKGIKFHKCYQECMGIFRSKPGGVGRPSRIKRRLAGIGNPPTALGRHPRNNNPGKYDLDKCQSLCAGKTGADRTKCINACLAIPAPKPGGRPGPQVTAPQCGPSRPCPSGQICVGGQCYQAIARKKATVRGIQCGPNQPCPMGLTCINGKCVQTITAPAGRFGRGIECGPNRPPCAMGLTCINGVCVQQITAPTRSRKVTRRGRRRNGGYGTACGPNMPPCNYPLTCVDGKCGMLIAAPTRTRKKVTRRRRRRNPARMLNQVGSAVAASLIAHAVKNVVFP